MGCMLDTEESKTDCMQGTIHGHDVVVVALPVVVQRSSDVTWVAKQLSIDQGLHVCMVLDIEHVPNAHERGVENTSAEARELFSTLLGYEIRVMLLVKVGIWTLWDEQGIT